MSFWAIFMTVYLTGELNEAENEIALILRDRNPWNIHASS